MSEYVTSVCVNINYCNFPSFLDRKVMTAFRFTRDVYKFKTLIFLFFFFLYIDLPYGWRGDGDVDVDVHAMIFVEAVQFQA